MTAIAVARPPARERTRAVTALSPGWAALRLSVARWSARQRLRRSIAHLDDRLLDDVGLEPRKRGLADRLIHRVAAGDGIWGATDRH